MEENTPSESADPNNQPEADPTPPENSEPTPAPAAPVSSAPDNAGEINRVMAELESLRDNVQKTRNEVSVVKTMLYASVILILVVVFYLINKTHNLEIKEKGKIRHIGVSNYNVQQMTECLKVGPLVSLQPEYSLLQRSVENEIVPFCLVHGIGLIAYSSLASGVLTGKYDRDTKFKDWRSKGIIGEFTGEAFVRNVGKVDQLKEVAAGLGKTCGQTAINWVVHQPAVATALVGVKNEKQMEENLKAVGWKLEGDPADRVKEIFAAS